MRDNGTGGIVACINVMRFVYKIVIGELKGKRLHWRHRRKL